MIVDAHAHAFPMVNNCGIYALLIEPFEAIDVCLPVLQAQLFVGFMKHWHSLAAHKLPNKSYVISCALFLINSWQRIVMYLPGHGRPRPESSWRRLSGSA